jgi:hypothetical protein
VAQAFGIAPVSRICRVCVFGLSDEELHHFVFGAVFVVAAVRVWIRACTDLIKCNDVAKVVFVQ